VIHEAFKGLEVRFYLAVIVENATEVVVVFPVRTFALPTVFANLNQALLPRLGILQKVWRGTRKCLYADGKLG
jgi:phosphatidylinositol N-acetylglucosaminyltransferase subunit H